MVNQSSNDALGDWRIVDETLSMVLPDKEPSLYQPPIPDPAPPSPPPLPMSELVASIEAKVQRAAVAARQHLLGPLYAHLSNVQVDWSLEGQSVCRVVGMKCHGKKMHKVYDLKRHLVNDEHRNYNAALAAAQAEPASSPSVPEPPTPVAPAPEMVPPGDGKSRGKATKRPRLALDAIIPDSEGEGSEDVFYHEPSPKRLRRSARTSVRRRQF
ncbi:uncharacterized protein FOBCDRAFT_275939 [Fusarium oxysporum Fo47]|uniref:Uncharacterized protein n=1 Tax=Fusarium oxysporum Fo47 TaxID=660027 RepID=W9KEV0_FUSOX|nr:uncharacterized protein FOBCDRAFT_275939 [Fusarium oxysporum Fo47]EWZ40480.1 hypothetical protein FOZG_09153 [Fusarium oxysporum Fo47]KAJ4151966.1 hypothetical protein NW765_013498 [Fusarium oxysporum]KAJ4285062.1 hypothetical protein NW764_000353 [Fusarium oxysporum]QKD56365.1 hypothetical protein FOBCDRAFT_275939 [Fusarium oxysporum Fo47]